MLKREYAFVDVCPYVLKIEVSIAVTVKNMETTYLVLYQLSYSKKEAISKRDSI